MLIKQLNLDHFRSYVKKEFLFSSGNTLIVGPNAVGKTNLLEAIYLLATGKSFRAQLDTEMIGYGQEFGKVTAKIKNNQENEQLQIILTTGQFLGRRIAKKKYLVNGVARRMIDFVGNLRVVFFGPEDLKIILNSPSVRREWLDSVLQQVDREYRRAIVSYYKGLRQRNKLLEQIREGGKPVSVLFFWNKLLLENGQIITDKREELIDFVNQQPGYFDHLKIVYEKNIISQQRLDHYQEKEIAAGVTLTGPHRDDFKIFSQNHTKERDLHAFGSRGEQRTAVFSLKLAELEFISFKTGERPLLLLDDIFSELDHQRRERLLSIIPKQQTIISTADIDLLSKKDLKKMKVIKLGK